MKERPQPTPEGFALTENEKLFDRVSDARFQQIIYDERTTIHEVKLSSNNYGEFIFATLSRETTKGRELLTFWGYGHHELRDRWLATQWFFHESHAFPQTLAKRMSREEARSILQARATEIASELDHKQSKHGALFELIAELTDDDGAQSELEDLNYLGLLLDDDENNE